MWLCMVCSANIPDDQWLCSTWSTLQDETEDLDEEDELLARVLHLCFTCVLEKL